MSINLALTKRCTICEKTSQDMSSCGRCFTRYYCSIECQKRDWKDHKPECIPHDNNKTVASLIDDVLKLDGVKQMLLKLAGAWSNKKGHNVLCVVTKSKNQMMHKQLKIVGSNKNFTNYDLTFRKVESDGDHLDRGELKTEICYIDLETNQPEYCVSLYFPITEYERLKNKISIDNAKGVLRLGGDKDDYENCTSGFTIQIVV